MPDEGNGVRVTLEYLSEQIGRVDRQLTKVIDDHEARLRVVEDETITLKSRQVQTTGALVGFDVLLHILRSIFLGK